MSHTWNFGEGRRRGTSRPSSPSATRRRYVFQWKLTVPKIPSFRAKKRCRRRNVPHWRRKRSRPSSSDTSWPDEQLPSEPSSRFVSLLNPDREQAEAGVDKFMSFTHFQAEEGEPSVVPGEEGADVGSIKDRFDKGEAFRTTGADGKILSVRLKAKFPPLLKSYSDLCWKFLAQCFKSFQREWSALSESMFLFSHFVSCQCLDH